ncbi:MAG TPA: hypothetical protein VEY50_00175, partial [Lysobacter sp.]|nr:hypothetical protein [Lysobacter sp.]
GAEELKPPDAAVYIVGMKSYGRAPTFLLLTGYEQVRSVVAAIDGDWDAARRVELVLPETGVCITDFGDEEVAANASSCCTPAAREPIAASCCGPAPAAEAPIAAASADCCGGPAPIGADACCVADVEAKAVGQAGCGCGPKPAVAPAVVASCCG